MSDFSRAEASISLSRSDFCRMGNESTLVRMRDVAKTYGSLRVLDRLNLDVPEGHVYGFLGRNGAGKSTAIRVMMGLSEADSGRVELFGKPVDGDISRLRERIGYVAQDQSMYPWMTPLNLAAFVRGFYPNWDETRYERLMRRFDLPPKRRIGTFSGGMRARMALTVALSTRPELLVLDEATAGMDPVARREFLDLVREQAEADGTTTFFSTHLMDEVEAIAECIGIVEGGRMLYQGSLRSLAESMAAWSIDPADAPAGSLPLSGEGHSGLFDVVSRHARRGRQQVVLRFADPHEMPDPEDILPGWQREPLSLEDMFVALVSRD